MLKFSRITSILLSVAILAGCGANNDTKPTPTPTPTETVTAMPTETPTQNPTAAPNGPIEESLHPGEVAFEALYTTERFDPNDISTFVFYPDVIFEGSEELAAEALEMGKNPGLGVRELHAQGITGEGVRVAIVDQSLAFPYHPEYGDRIVDYFDTGTGYPSDKGSEHGAAVAGLLVGKESGTAPGAKLYFAAAWAGTGVYSEDNEPFWKDFDSQYEANALRWIIEKNKELPDGDKIRLVSVSAAPSGPWAWREKNKEQWDEAVSEAKVAGILVLDCRTNEVMGTGFVGPAIFNDPFDRDNITNLKPGPEFDYVNDETPHRLHVPGSHRTCAENYVAGVNTWRYDGYWSSHSWSIPYAAGVLAMGWQVNPSLGNDEIVRLLFDTAYVDDSGFKYINPPAFIGAVKDTVTN